MNNKLTVYTDRASDTVQTKMNDFISIYLNTFAYSLRNYAAFFIPPPLSNDNYFNRVDTNKCAELIDHTRRVDHITRLN